MERRTIERKWRRMALRIALMVIALCASVAAWGQARPVAMNTASAGAKAADIEAAVSLICPASKRTRAKDGRVSGCRACPRGTDFVGDASSSWQLTAETPGHFAGAKEENLLLSGTGCDSHANNFGGTFVFALQAGKVRLVRYDQGLITDECRMFTFADGRDGLVCRGGWSGQGESDFSMNVLSFGATGKETAQTLISGSDSTGMCGDDRSQEVQMSDIKDFRLATKPGTPAAVTGLMVTATLGKVKCGQLQGNTMPSAVRTYAIAFVFDGKQFTVAAASRAALARFAAE